MGFCLAQAAARSGPRAARGLGRPWSEVAGRAQPALCLCCFPQSPGWGHRAGWGASTEKFSGGEGAFVGSCFN